MLNDLIDFDTTNKLQMEFNLKIKACEKVSFPTKITSR